ncbi:BTAD domain-containing putative transcriptional regulator [Kribbella qitaiheensis]|uniref:nSTAND1 domain-containing NTPase n=1 Tax=Kribbella qitaiheensis TaxID=1544730 RepID=UPI003610CBC3
MGIAVLGPLTIEGDHKALGRRDRVVLAALAVHPGDVVSAEVLADVLWGEQVPPSWPKVVQGCVVRLRKVLGIHAIETLPLGYRLAVPLDEIDAQRFERAVGRARELLAAGDAERSALVLADALTLWRGRPLADLDGWDVGRIEAGRLEELRHTAEELYVESALRSGQHDKVMAKAQGFVAEAPLRERRWVLLATAQYQAGRQGEALRTIQRLRNVLDRELGLDPSPGIDALERAILRQDPSLVVESALPEPSPDCPYLGLKSYDVDDADGFFGRDSDVAACLRKLSETSALAVVGPSGCGKSSLVRAGVAAALRRDGVRVVVMTPGAHPVAALAAAMPGQGAPPALVVDQCEEVFSLCQDTAERETFLTALSAHQAVAPLILSFRADRLADISSHPGFARAVEQGLYLLAGMTETDLRAAIEHPARLASLVVEPGLVDLLVNDVADQPGALPLMSHALAETWQRREGRTLTVAGYNASGGIRGAVAQSAEEIYERIPAGQRPVLRDLMLRLITPGPEGEPVRSRLPRRLVVTGPENDAMIDLLVRSRLVTSDTGVVELAHESLARAWPRLRGWLDDDLEGQKILHHLATLADSWDTLGRPDSELYRGVRLAKALDWQERTTLALTATEQDFLAESKRLSEAELRAAESQARHQARVNRRLRAALSTAAILLVGALIAGLVAVRQAERAERVATSELARRVGARAQLTEGISHSVLLAAHGARLDDSPETRANLVAAIGKLPTLVRSFPTSSRYVNGISVSPDGSRIAAGDDRAGFHLYDTGTGRVTDSYSFGPAAIEPAFSTARYSPDGRYLAATAAPSMLRLLDAETLDPLPIAIPPRTGSYLDIAFSADSRYLAASVWADSDLYDRDPEEPVRLLVWDLGTAGRAPREVAVPRGAQGIVLSPDGRTIYSQSPLTAYDVATRTQKWQRPDLRGLLSIDISTRGDLLALQLQNQEGAATATGLVDAHTGKTVKVLRGHTAPTDSLAFSRDDMLLGSTSLDGEVIVWDVATGTPRDRIKTFEPSPPMTVAGLELTPVSFSPDGQALYTGGDKGIIHVYDLSGHRQYLRRTQAVPARDYLHVLTSDDGRTTAYLWRDGKDSWVNFADTTTGATTTPARLGLELGERPLTSATWHPNGRHLAIHDIDEITVVDSQTGKVRKEQLDLEISAMTYVERGARIAVADSLGYLRIFDAETLLPSGTVPLWGALGAASPDGETAVVFGSFSREPVDQRWRIIRIATGTVVSDGDLQRLLVTDATYSPDGRRIAVIGVNGEVLTIDAQSRQVRRAPAGHKDEGLFVRFSPDGSRLVSGAADGTVSLWDARTLDLLGTVATSTGAEPVAVSPSFAEGNDIVTIAAYDGQTYRWDTRLEQAIAYACTMAGRNLTPDEWTQAFADRPYEKTCP